MRRVWVALVIIVCVMIVPVIVNNQRTDYQAQPKRVYTYFIPIIARPFGLFGHGVANNPSIIKPDWYYDYWACQSPCVPMNRNGDVPQGWCAPYQLLFNEPTYPEPAGHPISVTDAITVSQAVRAECPNAYIVAANFIQYPEGLQWTLDYIAGGGVYDAIGFHCYSGQASGCINYIKSIKAQFPNTRLCLTEYNTWTYDVVEFERLVSFVLDNLECSALFISRGWDDDLLNLESRNGGLTEKGIIFQRLLDAR